MYSNQTSDLTYYVKEIDPSVEFYKKSLKCNIISKDESTARLYSHNGECFITLQKHEIDDYVKTIPCARCRNPFPDYKLKYDDEYLEELVCKECAGIRKCEKCYKPCYVEKLVLGEDNYLVCKKCYDFDFIPCRRCNRYYYSFEVNYEINNKYLCNHCEIRVQKEEEEEYYEDNN